MENFNQTILHEYPYPIAKCYENVMGARDAVERWEKIRQLYEATIKYCSCFAISEYLQTEHEDQKINTALSYLSKPTMGHWFNLFRLCSGYCRNQGKSLFPESAFDKIKDRPDLIAGFNKIKTFLETGKHFQSESVSLLVYLELWVTYRNRTSGHGAPQRAHIEELNPFLEKAFIDVLLNLSILKQTTLVFLSDIRAERQSFVHLLYRLMGTSKIAIRDYVTSKEDALLGLDKCLMICSPESEKPVLSVHPLMIFSNDDVYLLHSSDLKHNVEYICHHSGAFYSADRIYEDFKEKLGAFFPGYAAETGIDSEGIYSNAVRISLLDGIIEEEERSSLDAMRHQLGLSDERAKKLEETVFIKLGILVDSAIEPKTTAQAPIIIPYEQTSREIGINKHDYSRILFYPYASVRLGFWAELVSRLASQAFKNNMAFSMVAPDPSADYDSSAMIALLASADDIMNMYQPDLVIMVPSFSQSFTELFHKKFQKILCSLMTVDTEFYEYDYFKEHGLPVPPIVQIDNYEGGRLAAGILMRGLNKEGSDLRLLVMPGIEDTPHSKARIQGFEDAIRYKHPDARIRMLPSANFQREKARQIMDNYCEDIDIEKYQGIFCCNDEMALGVYASLNHKFDNNLNFGIVGFNNTLEMQHSVLMDKMGWLKGTISQNFPEYISTIIQVAKKLLRGSPVEQKYLIKPIEIHK